MEGNLLVYQVYSVLNTNSNTIYIFLHKKQTEQSRDVKKHKRKAKKELKQSTKCYKIYCGVEHSRARYFKKAREYFQTRLRIVFETIENIFFDI